MYHDVLGAKWRKGGERYAASTVIHYTRRAIVIYRRKNRGGGWRERGREEEEEWGERGSEKEALSVLSVTGRQFDAIDTVCCRCCLQAAVNRNCQEPVHTGREWKANTMNELTTRKNAPTVRLV